VTIRRKATCYLPAPLASLNGYNATPPCTPAGLLGLNLECSLKRWGEPANRLLKG
jgi:hypothetical protein